MPTIVIDPGHGGNDSGASYYGRKESDDNLRLGLAVADRLKRLGYNAILTRDSDRYVSLGARSRISNDANADLFVSLHRDAGANPLYNGITMIVYTSPSSASINAARNIGNSLARAGVQSNHGITYQNLSVLRQTNAPSTLAEVGFISNLYDNTLFDTRFDAYADAIVSGIQETVPLPQTSIPGRNARIRQIQQTLNSRYNTGLVVDGYYGPKTKAALIKGLQSELNWNYNAGLVADGIYGPRTKAALRNVRYGDSNYLVWILQALLFLDGYNITVDGVFGRNTQNAVIDFQNKHGLTPDGIAGRNTFDALIRSI